MTTSVELANKATHQAPDVVMDNTIELIHDLSTAENHTAQIESTVEKVDRELQEIHNDLEQSRTINRSLHTLNSSLSTTSQLLTVVSIVPKIGAAAAALKRTIDLLHPSIKKAVKASDSLEKVVGPIRDRIEQLEAKVDETDQILLDTMNRENQLLEVLGGARDCISTLSHTSTQITLSQQLETVSSGINPVVSTFDAVQVKTLNTLNEIDHQVDKIHAWSERLVNLEDEINRVITTLAPLTKALKELKKAFKQTIRVPYGGYPKMCRGNRWGVPYTYPCGWQTQYFSFTIQQILDGATGVIEPVMKLLNDAMYKVLNPLLRKLNLNIKLPEIPGLEILEQLADKLESEIKSVVGDLYGTINQIEKPMLALIQQCQQTIDAISGINTDCLIHRNDPA